MSRQEIICGVSFSEGKHSGAWTGSVWCQGAHHLRLVPSSMYITDCGFTNFEGLNSWIDTWPSCLVMSAILDFVDKFRRPCGYCSKSVGRACRALVLCMTRVDERYRLEILPLRTMLLTESMLVVCSLLPRKSAGRTSHSAEILSSARDVGNFCAKPALLLYRAPWQILTSANGEALEATIGSCRRVESIAKLEEQFPVENGQQNIKFRLPEIGLYGRTSFRSLSA